VKRRRYCRVQDQTLRNLASYAQDIDNEDI
jgi:hypothetical protein